MRRLGLAKKALLLALCAALAVPATGLGWTPMTVEAAETGTPDEDKPEDNSADKTQNADAAYKQNAVSQIDQYYIVIQNEIKAAGNEEKAKEAIQQAKDTINKNTLSQGMVDMAVSNVQAILDGLKTKTEEPEQPEPEPTLEERLEAAEEENRQLKAQVKAQSQSLLMLEDCLVEMAGVVYA